MKLKRKQPTLPAVPAVIFLLMLLGVADAASAHPFGILHAKLRVHPEKIEVDVIVTLEDFYYAFDLPVNEFGILRIEDVEPSVERYKEKLREDFVIRDMDGNPLEGRVMAAVPQSADTWEELPESMEGEIRYELEYELGMAPGFLDVSHTFGGAKTMFPSVLKLDVTQAGHPPRERELVGKGTKTRVAFDWLSAPPDAVASSPEVREQTRQERLGITSYGSIYSFLYVEPDEVRHEILVPLATVEALGVELVRARPSVLVVAEQEAAAERIFQFFARRNPIRIDGEGVLPDRERVDFFDLEIRDLALRTEPRDVPFHIARVGLILSYPSPRPPREVDLEWDVFSKDILDVRTTVLTRDGARQEILKPDQASLKWSREGQATEPIEAISSPESPGVRVPVASFGVLLLLLPLLVLLRGKVGRGLLLGVGALGFLIASLLWPVASLELGGPPVRPDDEEATRIFTALHGNLYRSFDAGGEEAIYDALDKSARGEVLADLYLAIHEGLVMQEQGGATSRVDAVSLEEVEVRDGEGDGAGRRFGVDCTYTVRGTVEHWGHIHSRTNRYRVEAEVGEEKEAWKITRFEVREQERVGFETRVRRME